MSAQLLLSDAFLNKSLRLFGPKEAEKLTIRILEYSVQIIRTVDLKLFKLHPGVALRLVSYFWSKERKEFVLEMTDSSPVDPLVTIGLIKRFLPPYISVDGKIFTIQLNEIPGVKEKLDLHPFGWMDISAIKLNEGELKITFDWELAPLDEQLIAESTQSIVE